MQSTAAARYGICGLEAWGFQGLLLDEEADDSQTEAEDDDAGVEIEEGSTYSTAGMKPKPSPEFGKAFQLLSAQYCKSG